MGGPWEPRYRDPRVPRILMSGHQKGHARLRTRTATVPLHAQATAATTNARIVVLLPQPGRLAEQEAADDEPRDHEPVRDDRPGSGDLAGPRPRQRRDVPR